MTEKKEAGSKALRDLSASEAMEIGALFDLRYRADMKAIKLWQEAHPGNDLTWPDHADLVVWMLEELEAERRRGIVLRDMLEQHR